MREYELAIIIDSNTDEEGVTATVEKVSQFVKTLSGEVASVNVWGRRILAYPIEKHRDGIYVLFNLKMQPQSMVDLERNLKLTEQIIRYLLVVKEE